MDGWPRQLLVIALLAGAVWTGPAFAQSPAADYRFPSGAGLLMFHVRPDRAQDFEAVVARLATALDNAADPVRREQADGWRMFKSVEAVRDAVVYVFVFTPAAAGADYDPVKVLSESAPAEGAALYQRLRAAVIRVERMGLTSLR